MFAADGVDVQKEWSRLLGKAYLLVLIFIAFLIIVLSDACYMQHTRDLWHKCIASEVAAFDHTKHSITSLSFHIVSCGYRLTTKLRMHCGWQFGNLLQS